jgi:hypothetical protein
MKVQYRIKKAIGNRQAESKKAKKADRNKLIKETEA